MDLKKLQCEANKMAREKGFWDKTTRIECAPSDVMVPTILEKLCLVHSEVSEALEDYRTAKDRTDITTTRFDAKGKPIGFPTELADIIIRVVDLAEQLGIDLDAEVKTKMEYNSTRPWKHGKSI